MRPSPIPELVLGRETIGDSICCAAVPARLTEAPIAVAANPSAETGKQVPLSTALLRYCAAFATTAQPRPTLPRSPRKASACRRWLGAAECAELAHQGRAPRRARDLLFA